jgi:hypothetical protein
MAVPPQFRNFGTVLFFLGTLFSVFFVCLWITQSALNVQKKHVPHWIAVTTLVFGVLSGLYAVTIMSCDIAMLFGVNPYKSKIFPCSAAMRSSEFVDSMSTKRDYLRQA